MNWNAAGKTRADVLVLEQHSQRFFRVDHRKRRVSRLFLSLVTA